MKNTLGIFCLISLFFCTTFGINANEYNLENGTFNLNEYHSFEEIVSYLNDIANQHKAFVELKTLGKSFEGRDLAVVKIGYPAKTQKNAMLLDAGFHASEWNGHASALYFINTLVTNLTLIPMLHDIDIYVIPVANPDGYEYSRRNATTNNWRYTRSGPHGTRKCYGADMNRNFDFHWGTDGVTNDPCAEPFDKPGDTYCGEKPLSEPEAEALQNFLTKNKESIKCYVNLHSPPHNYTLGHEVIMYPYGCCKNNYSIPDDVEDLKRVGKSAADAIVAVGGPRYKVGSLQDIVKYNASGASMDYAKSIGIKYSYSIEIGHQFQVPKEEIEQTATQIVAALLVFAGEVQDIGNSAVIANLPFYVCFILFNVCSLTNWL
ncbi:zinc carboxypeptidase domain-containing protein [Ditylenchus destructor]|uniref:Zinc carboxypeptidase domain-containing protein n=1 Tax=Ditylenchus destructor TaxID=166010 RepID=A0AAD4MHV1_9BILA|nr:zinc carboxypeptidase domain-containing protein [Ditylenchus destructor]